MRWWPQRRTRTTAAFSALVVALGALAVLHDGTDVADLDLNDGGVWVTYLNMDGGRSVAAHLNYPSREIDSYTEPPTSSFDVSQSAYDVVLHDRAANTVAPVDTQTWATGAAAALPQGALAVQGGDVVAVADPNGGRVWVTDATQVSTLNPESEPALAELPGIRAVVGTDGTVHAVTPDGTVRSSTGPVQAPAFEESGSVPPIADGDDVTLSTVGAVPVVLDRTQGWIATPDARADLDDAADLLLQQPGTSSDTVALAGPDALVTWPVDGGDAVRRSVRPGTAIPPVHNAGCTYAAWPGSGAFVRDCDGTDRDDSREYPQVAELSADPSQTVFRVNREVVVLNDTITGTLVLVDDDMAVVDDWQNVLADLQRDEDDQDSATIQAEFQRQEENRPPKPAPDSFGVRAGQPASLPVLANDSDPDGDVLVAGVEDATTDLGPVTKVRQARSLRIEVPEDAAGSTVLTYSASDGREQGTVTSTATIEVHPTAENAPPARFRGRTSQISTVQRGTATYHALGDFHDPDGDPFWLADVEFPEGMDGTFRPDGTIRVSDDGVEPARSTTLTAVLTDGRDTTDVPVTVQVKPRTAPVAPVANADYATAVVGEDVTVRPLRNDVNGASTPLTLAEVRGDESTRVSGDLAEGSVTVSSDSPGVRYLDYSISNGPQRAEGVIRVDVLPSAVDGVPLPDDDTVVLPPSGRATADVLANDTDPRDGVLVLRSVTAPDGVSASVVDHDRLSLQATGDLDASAGAELTYEVANAAGSSTGTVRVVPSAPRPPGTPLAYDDQATVRSDDVVTVDVVANDVSPDDRELTLQPEVTLTQGAGLGEAFVSQGRLRFKATGESGTVTAQYTVLDPDANAATGKVTIDITPLSGSNAAPSPTPLTARLIQGGTSRLQVPLDGIDPDGDSATLLGLQDSPTRGTATIDGSVITYTAAATSDALGSDRFTYLVEDRFGAVATGEVRVGIAARPTTDEPPVTTLDQLDVRPDRGLAVPVLANDNDPEGEPLQLVRGSVEPVDGGTSTEAGVQDGRVGLTTPAEATTLRYTYVASDSAGNEAPGDLTVTVDPDAPLQAPVARDDIVPLSAVVGQDEVAVDVLDNDDDPDGSAEALTPASDLDGVRVDAKKRLVVPLTPQRQVVVYRVSDRDGQEARAVVVVPGTESLAAQRPVLRPGLDLPFRVDAGQPLRLDVTDLVAVREGRAPSVPLTEDVTPGPGWDGGQKLLDPTTLVFTSEPDFYGPTSMTFLVSDERGKDDTSRQTAVLTVPIEVVASGDNPPTFTAPRVLVTPGGEPWTGDLRRTAADPDPGDVDRLEFTVDRRDDGISAGVEDGHVLRVGADAGTPVGSSNEIVLSVSDGLHTVGDQRVQVVTVASDAPPITVRPGTIRDALAGQPVQVDVADYVTNPLAAEGGTISLVGAPTVTDGAAVDPTGDTTFTVTPGADFSGILTASYVVGDSTGQADRQRRGQVSVVVRGRPDAPQAVTAVATASRTVEVRWRAGANNGAPITGYQVEWTGGGSGSATVGNQTALTVDGLTNNREYVFTVTATNAAGDSDRSAPSRPARPDAIPPAPTGVQVSFRDQALDVSWGAVRPDGSPVVRYDVSVGGQQLQTQATRVTATGLTNGRSYEVRVRAVNSAEAETGGVPGAGPWSATVTETPNGVPDAPGNLRIDADGPDPDPSAVISWRPGSDNGAPVEAFEVRRSGGGVVPCAGDVSQSSCRVALPKGERARYEVRLRNRANPAAGIDGWGAWSAPTAEVAGATPPSAVRNLRVSATGSSGQARVDFGAADLNGADSIDYRYRLQGGGSGGIRPGDTVGGFANGEDRTITVWAVSTANGKQSDPGPEASAGGSSFAPCEVSVSRVRENYDNVTFRWQVTSRGRPCDFSGDAGGSVPVNQQRSGEQNKGSGPNQNVSFSVTTSTRTGGGDAGVGNRNASQSGSTANPRFSVRQGGNRNATTDYVEVRAIGLNESRSVYCFAQGSPGVPNWYATFSTGGDGNSGWVGNGPNGRLYDSVGDRYPKGTFPFGQNVSGLTCRLN